MTTRLEQQRRMYGRPTEGGGSLDLATANYYDRRDSGLRDDPERLAQSRNERQQTRRFLEAHGISPNRAQEVLDVLREHDLRPRRADDARWKSTFEHLRLQTGSEATAREIFERAQVGAKVIGRDLPALAARADASGAVADPKVMQFLAQVADAPPSEPPAAA